MTNPIHSRSTQRGGTLAVVTHAVLLACVLGQTVYLASRYRVRFDMTSDQRYTVTDSTRAILGKLDKQLLIEAYFSPKENLPVLYRNTRTVLDNFLDELVQLGKGKVVVQRYDPNSDTAVADRAKRVGVQPADLRGGTSTSISVDRHWQGLRLVYGGGKQKVLTQLAPQTSFLAEASITPAIKEVVTSQKHKFGYMEWPAQAIGQQQPGGIGWNLLRTVDDIAKRYEFQNYKDEDGALLPDDLKTLFLFRPKDLTDRQKYVLDQFVVKGGTLVVFADAAEYAIGPQRLFTKLPLQADAAGSNRKWVDQLANYGIDWRPKVLADMSEAAYSPRDRFQGAAEYLAMPQQTVFGQQAMTPVPYPYFFHAVALDWGQRAEDLARRKTGDGKPTFKPDPAVVAQYQKQFVAGLPSDEFLFKTFKQLGRGPGFYWPTWVGLREKAGGAPDLPEGVSGKVLLWSSPLVLAEDPPQSLDALGRDPRDQKKVNEQFGKFSQKLLERLQSEPAQQAPLMVDVRGRFSSFFAGADRPKRPSEIKEEEDAKKAAEGKPADEQGKDGKEADVAAAKKDPKELIGPEAPKAKEDEKKPKPPPEPAMVAKAEKPGRIVVVGDSDFIRDDLLQRAYMQSGGPVSLFGGVFFSQMLDWLAEDQDLVALQSRVGTDHTLKIVDTAVGGSADPRAAEQALASKTRWLRGLNIVVPPLLLAAFGFVVLLVRRGQKRRFLESLNQ